MVQRKVVFGDSDSNGQYNPRVNTTRSGIPAADAQIDAPETVRFADRNQWKKYATNRDGIAGMVDNKWVLLPKKGMLVVGEDHGTSHAEQWKAVASQWRQERGAGRSTRGVTTLGADADASRSVEHAIPKAARSLPEIGDALTNQGRDGGFPLAGQPLPGGYSLAKAALGVFKHSLLLLRSYENHGGRGIFRKKVPPLTTFYRANKVNIEASITALELALGNAIMPDVAALPIWPRYNALMDVFQEEAEVKVGLSGAGEYDRFKKKLGTGSAVTLNARAERNDILRDKSMLDTIKSAKGSTRVFIIGDSHRQKLEGHGDMQKLVSSGDVTFVDEAVYLRDQNDLNRQARQA